VQLRRFTSDNAQNAFGHQGWLWQLFFPMSPSSGNPFSPWIVVTDPIGSKLLVLPRVALYVTWFHQGDPDMEGLYFMTQSLRIPFQGKFAR
jgi:hypothetical protein